MRFSSTSQSSRLLRSTQYYSIISGFLKVCRSKEQKRSKKEKMAGNEGLADQSGFDYDAFLHPDKYDNLLQESGYYMNPYFLLHFLQPEYFDLSLRHNTHLFNHPMMSGQGSGPRDCTGIVFGNLGNRIPMEVGNQGFFPNNSVTSNTVKYQETDTYVHSSVHEQQLTLSVPEAGNKPNSLNSLIPDAETESFQSSSKTNSNNLPQNTSTCDSTDKNSKNGEERGHGTNRNAREVGNEESNLSIRTLNSNASEVNASGTHDDHTADAPTNDGDFNNFLDEPVMNESDLKVLWSVVRNHIDIE